MAYLTIRRVPWLEDDSRNGQTDGNVSSEDDDRNAIVARRAVLVASALAQASLPLVALADEQPHGAATAEDLPPCPTPPPPSPEALAEAAVRFAQAEKLFAERKWAEASVEARRVLLLAPHEKAVLLAMQADVQRGAPQDAHEIGSEHLRCTGVATSGGLGADIAERLRTLERETGTVVVHVRDADRLAVRLDDGFVDVRRASRGIRLAPGGHFVTISRDGRELRRDFRIVAGETVVIDFEDLPPPLPCLSIPHPCLSPPPPPTRDESLLRGSVGAVVPILGALTGDPARVIGGGGAHAGIGWQFADGFWLDGHVFGAGVFGDESPFIPVGTSAVVKGFPVEVFGLGAGFSGGYVFTADDPTMRIAPSGFFGPVLIPAAFAIDVVEIEARVPIWFSQVRDGDDVRLGLSMVAPYVVVAVAVPILEKRSDPGMAKR